MHNTIRGNAYETIDTVAPSAEPVENKAASAPTTSHARCRESPTIKPAPGNHEASPDDCSSYIATLREELSKVGCRLASILYVKPSTLMHKAKTVSRHIQTKSTYHNKHAGRTGLFTCSNTMHVQNALTSRGCWWSTCSPTGRRVLGWAL